MPKKRVINALLGRSIDRIPAFCSGCPQTITIECMEAIGVYWPDAHRESEKMAKLSASVNNLIGLEVAGVPYCLTIEAEALGCQIKWGEKKSTIPQVIQSPYKAAADVNITDNFLNLKRVPVVLKAIKILKEDIGDHLPIVAGLTGPFTLAAHLYEVEKLLKGIVLTPDVVRDFIDVATEVGSTLGKAMLDAGADVVGVADPIASGNLIDASMFRTFAKPAITKVIKAIDGLTILHICGRITPILKDMADTGATAISFDENVDPAEAKKITRGRVRLVGNLSCSHTLLLGTPEKVKEEALKALKAGIDLLAPGCGIPPETPTANYRALVEAAIEFEKN